MSQTFPGFATVALQRDIPVASCTMLPHPRNWRLMKITPEELQRAYRGMSDEELLSLDREELTGMALQCHDEEMARRRLEARPDGAPAPRQDAGEGEPWVCAGIFRTIDEAQVVRGLLESEELP